MADQVGQAPAETPAEKKEKKDAESRIQELNRRNAELEKLVNMNQRISGLENAAAQIGQRLQEQPRQQQAPNEWDTFMRPKVEPIIREALAPYEQAIRGLADQNDYLKTMNMYPEYKDPEVQQEVDQLRNARLQQSGQLESRENVLLYMRGRNPERFSKPKEEPEREEPKQPVHVEGQNGMGNSRARVPGQKTAEEATVEEMEKFMMETNMKF